MGTATYSVDGAKPVAFSLNGVAAQRTGVQYNQILFETPSLPLGEHTLDVVYLGNTTTAPLSISVVYIQNGTSSLSPTVPSNPPPTSSGSSLTTTATQPNVTVNPGPHSVASAGGTTLSGQVGGIIGAILGGIAIITLLIVGLSQRYKGWKRTRNQQQMAEVQPSSSHKRSSILPMSKSPTAIPPVQELATPRQEERSIQAPDASETHPIFNPFEIEEIPRNPVTH